MPLSTENLRIDREFAVAHGGSPCLRVASGRFIEDAEQGLAILLSPLDPAKETRLVVATQDGERAWKTTEIWRWSIPTFRIYVETAKPGRYSRSLSVDEALGRGEVTSVDTPHDGILSGMTGSFEYGFFRVKKRWIHVRIAE